MTEEGRRRIGEANKKRVWSKESLKKMSLDRVRESLSIETRRKMSDSHKGYEHSLETRQKISKSHLGKKREAFTAEHCRKISKGNKGKVLSLSSRINISNGKIGDKNPSWRGGVSSVNQRIRRSLRYRLWREGVFKRDDWTCRLCPKPVIRGGELHADHIKPFAFHPESRFDVSNGRTLCVPCHKKTETYGWKVHSWAKEHKVSLVP